MSLSRLLIQTMCYEDGMHLLSVCFSYFSLTCHHTSSRVTGEHTNEGFHAKRAQVIFGTQAKYGWYFKLHLLVRKFGR
jgi:hypothetical protein